MIKKIQLKKDIPDAVYTAFCNKMEKQGVFVACGNCDDKWIMGKWDDEIDFAAWFIATAGGKIIEEDLK